MKVRASQITPTSISPDLNAGASASVSGYSRSPLAFSFSMNALALSKSVVLPLSCRLAACIIHCATVLTMPILPFHFGSSRSLMVCGGCFTVSGLYTSTCAL